MYRVYGTVLIKYAYWSLRGVHVLQKCVAVHIRRTVLRVGPAYIDSDVVSCRWEQKKVPKNNLPRSNVVSRVSASVFWGFWLGITLVADSKIGFWLFTKCIFFCSRSTRPYRESRAVHVRLFWGRRTGRTCTFWEQCVPHLNLQLVLGTPSQCLSRRNNKKETSTTFEYTTRVLGRQLMHFFCSKITFFVQESRHNSTANWANLQRRSTS